MVNFLLEYQTGLKILMKLPVESSGGSIFDLILKQIMIEIFMEELKK
jgi:hypothetical protein